MIHQDKQSADSEVKSLIYPVPGKRPDLPRAGNLLAADNCIPLSTTHQLDRPISNHGEAACLLRSTECAHLIHSTFFFFFLSFFVAAAFFLYKSYTFALYSVFDLYRSVLYI